MNRTFAAVLAVGLNAITGCTTRQLSGGRVSFAERGAVTNDEPAQPGSQHRSGLRSRRAACRRHLHDGAAMGRLQGLSPARMQPIART